MTRVNLGDRKLILGRVDRQHLYLLMSGQTDTTSGDENLRHRQPGLVETSAVFG